MNITTGFNNTSSYGINNKQNIRFCGMKNYVDLHYAQGLTRLSKGGRKATTQRQDYGLVRKVVALIRRQNPSAQAEITSNGHWKNINSSLRHPEQLLDKDVKVGAQHVSATKLSLEEAPDNVTIRLYTKTTPTTVMEEHYNLSPEDTSTKAVAKLNGLFA